MASRFYHLPCPSCTQSFGPQDDIVVCPDCGAPHHRACYQEAGHCVLEHLHETGEQWHPPIPLEQPTGAAAPSQEGMAPCPHCGSQNPSGTLLCMNCGWRLGAEPSHPQDSPQQQAPGGQTWSPYGPQGHRQGQNRGQGPASGTFDAFFQQGVTFQEEMAEGVTFKEVSDFVGPNSLRFIVRFQSLLKGASISFNWSAFFFSFFYCFYRKMYKLGAIVLAITLTVFVPTTVFTVLYYGDVVRQMGVEAFFSPLQLPIVTSQWLGLFQLFNNLSNFTTLILSIGLGFAFNKLYLRETVKRIKAIRQDCRCSTGSIEYSHALLRQGGVAAGPVLILVAGYLVVSMVSAFFTIT